MRESSRKRRSQNTHEESARFKQVCINSLHKPKLLLSIEIFPFGKLLELLAINHSLSERRDIFCSLAVEVLPFFVCFSTCMGTHFPAVEMNHVIRFSALSRVLGFLWHSSKWSNGASVVSFDTQQGLKCQHVDLNTAFNYVVTVLQLCPSFNYSATFSQV